MLGAGKLRAWDASAVRHHHAGKLGAEPNGMPKLRLLETGPAYRFATGRMNLCRKLQLASRPGQDRHNSFNSWERRRV
jgi:hypothetical protein